MPKIKSYSAPWLSSPNAPGHQLFAPSADSARPRALGPASKSQSFPGPKRTIARRGTEVFVAVGKEIRWADLAYLEDAWKSRGGMGSDAVRVKREETVQSIQSDGEVDAAAGLRVRLMSGPGLYLHDSARHHESHRG